MRLTNGVHILLFSLFIHRAFTERDASAPQGPIFIYEPPSHVTFANNHGALIQCSAFGRPSPQIKWVHENGSVVENLAGVIEIFPNNSLHFMPFQESDVRNDVHTANYRCEAKNVVGTIVSRKVSVKAVLIEKYRAYKYHVGVNNEWVIRGNTAVFKCDIDPHYVKDYVSVTSWAKGTNPITPDERYSILSSGELHIRNVRNEDSHLTYRCTTRNILTGEEKTSLPASLHIAESVNTEPEIQDSLSEVHIQQGHAIELPCAASGYPLPSYTWSKDGRRLEITQQRVSQVGGNLIINEALIADSGTYECTATNTLSSKTATTALTVTAPLSVLVEPTEQTVDAGNVAIFNCTIFGHPVLSVTWLKDGQPVGKSTRITVQSERTLKILNVSRVDKGMYQCLAANTKENAQGSAQLTLGAAAPQLHDVFIQQYIRPNNRVSLRCVVSGNPTPQVTWTLDDQPLPKDGRYRAGSYVTAQGDVVSHVNVSNIRVPDGGQYRCSASNKVGSISHAERVNVYGVPYIRPMQNVTAVASERLVLPCYVAGFPIRQIEWSKGGNTLPSNHRQSVSRRGVLIIDNVQKLYDEGEYVCTASNFDSQTAHSSVYIHVMEPPKIDAFHFPKRKQGDRVSVSCVVSSGDMPITIQWMKDGIQIPPDLGISIQQHDPYSSALSIFDANPRHNGNYTCVASNAAESVNHTAALHVDVPPRWVVEPSDSYVVLHRDVVINCKTAGTPEPQVIWRKARGDEPRDYQDIAYNRLASNGKPRHQLMSNGSLIIRETIESDHGYYLCHASNGIGAGLSKVIFLTVHIPARFAVTQKNHTVMKGSNISVLCDAIGDKPLSLTWRFHREELRWQTNQRLDVVKYPTPKGSSSKLTIKPTIRGDSGFYVCIAKNYFGDATLLVQLTVLEKPDAPTNIQLEERTSRSAKISWTRPFDGNSPITSFVIQYKNRTEPWRNPMTNVTVLPNITFATIRGLHPAYQYSVQVIALNKLGFGLPSKTLNFTTDEEAPSGPPMNVNAVATGSQSLKITWEAPKSDKQNGVIKGYYVGYKVYNSSTPYNYVTRPVYDDFTPEFSIINLEKFTRYTMHVQAFNAKGAGPKSADRMVLTLEDVPSRPPQGVQATPIGSTSIKVVWSPPPYYTLNGILQGYKVLYKPIRVDEDESDAQVLTTGKLTIAIYGLEKYSNYSIQVLAFTRMGEGIRSAPIYVVTQQDAPSQPSAIKALAVNESTILITWRPPVHPNGVLTKYIVYFRYRDETQKESIDRLEVAPEELSYRLSGLKVNYAYKFQVAAATMIGEGERSREVTQSPVHRVAARIASFTRTIRTPWKQDVQLPCIVVGDPAPSIEWKKRDMSVGPTDRVRVLKNGSLELQTVQSSDAATYTCKAVNQYGSDEIKYTLIVLVNHNTGLPPRAPTLEVAVTTSTSIQLNWRSGSNGGSRIQGFILQMKKEHDQWTELTVAAPNRSHTAQDLMCGTAYKFQIKAFNRIGPGDPSRIVTSKTNGSMPIMPPQSMLLQNISATHVTLNLASWLTDGCPITKFSVRYQVWGDDVWHTVATDISSKEANYTVQDLHPATWYIMKVSAHSDAGTVDSQLKFATLTYEGGTIQPLVITHKYEPEFYERFYIMVPLVSGAVIMLVVCLGGFLYWRRRQESLRYKESKSNLRRDLTAETSLMNDLDKRFDKDSDGSDLNYTPDPAHNVNVNLLILDTSNENLNDDTSTWLYQQNVTNAHQEATRSASIDSEGNINPYATFQYPPPPGQTIISYCPQIHESQDLIALEKERAQREFEKHMRMAENLPPPPPELLCPDVNLQTHPKYQNQEVHPTLILSPRKYASADAINALFTGRCRTYAPSHTYSIPSTSRPNSQMSAQLYGEKHGQRHSAISSVTTVSSNHDELMLAYQNSCQRTSATPTIFELQQQDSVSQPTNTDSSDTTVTEPGIRQFTQSPPKPEERRQAACEVPLYEQRSRRPSHIDLSSDATDYEPYPRRRKSPHRKSKARRTRGHVLGKKVIRASRGPPSRCSRPSSSSTTASEEVTYCFDERALRARPSSPSEGYLSYPYTESESNPYYTRRRVSRPSSKHMPGFDMTPDTPGTDESKPLVLAVAKPGLSSPPEEDEDIRILDRIYRTVKDEDDDLGTRVKLLNDDEQRGYTDDFTVV